MPQSSGTDFTQGNIMRHVTVMSFTSSIGIMAIYVVDLLDIFFVSLLGQTEVAAAAGFASTLMFYVSAMNIGLSIAAGTLTARYLGNNDLKSAKDVATTSMLIALSVGIVVPLLMLPFIPSMLSWLGAKGEVADLAQVYLWIVLPASGLSGMSMALVASLRSHGFARWSMYPSLAGAVVNLIFDPLLIFGLNMGLPGAAAATVMARVATFAVALYAAARLFDIIAPPSRDAFQRYTREIVQYTLPAVLASVASPIGLSLVTRYITQFGTDAVAGLAIIGRLSPVVFSVVNALSGAIGPIIGQNYGAGKHDRVRRAYFDALKFLAIYTVCAIFLLVLFRREIADIFQATGLTRDMLYLYCGPYAMIAFFNGALFISNAAFGNLGRPEISPRINWLKSTIGLWPFLAAGSYLFGFYGVAVGIMLNAAVFALIAHLMTMRLIENARTQKPVDVDEDADALQATLAMEHKEPQHT
jgi:putative MATE family efflux protein